MPNQIVPLNPQGQSEQTRRYLELTGTEPDTAAKLMYGPAGTSVPSSTDREYSYEEFQALNALANSGGLISDLRNTMPGYADTLDQKDLTSYYQTLPDQGLDVDYLRQQYRDWRTDASINLVKLTNNPQSYADAMEESEKPGGWTTFLQLLGGAAEPLGRPQQFLFGLMSGENLGTAWSRMTPESVVDPDTGREITPAAQAWETITGGFDNWDTNVEALSEVNAVQGQKLISFMDLPDAWFGEGTMDDMYESLADSGPLGNVGMALMAGAYAAGDMFVDPLMIFEAAPKAVISAAKSGLSTVTRASQLAQVAKRTDRGADLGRALSAAKEHLQRAAKVHEVEKSQASATRLKQAINNLAERQDDIERHRVVTEYDTVNPSASPPRRNPKTYQTSEITDRVYGAGVRETYKTVRSIQREIKQMLNEMVLYRKMMGDKEFSADDLSGLYSRKVRMLEDELDRVRRGHRIPIETGIEGFTPKQHKQLYEDLLGIRRQMLDDMATLGDEGAEAAADMRLEIDRLDEYLLALDEGRAGSVPFELEFAGKYRRRRTTQELLDEIEMDEMDANVETTETFQPIHQGDHAQMLLAEGAGSLQEAGPTNLGLDELADSVELDGIRYNQKTGLGSVPNNQEVGYKGYVAFMKADEFLQLNPVRPSTRKPFSPELIREGNEIASPFVSVELDEAGQLRVVGHEGRGRAAAIREVNPEATVPVHVFVPDEVRHSDEFADLIERALLPDKRAGTDALPVRPRGVRVSEQWAPNRTNRPLNLQLLDRMTFGADDAEYAAEGLGRLVHGDHPNNITAPLVLSPERQALTGGRIVPGVTTRGLVDPAYTAGKLGKMKAASDRKAWVWRGGKLDGKRIRQGDLLDEAQRLVQEEGLEFDDSWLPQPRKTAQELMEEGWNEAYGRTALDRIAPALYGNYRIPLPNVLKASIFPVREPMRVLGVEDPASWEILRHGMMNHEAEVARLNAVFGEEMKRFGVFEEYDLNAVRRAVETSPPKHKKWNDDLNRLLFDILDEDPDSALFAELTEDLTSQQYRAVLNIRKELDMIAGRLGVTGSKGFIKGYMPHAFDAKWFDKGKFPSTFQGMSGDGNLFLRHLLDRTGNAEYNRNAAAALDMYTRGVSRKIHVEPTIKAMRKRIDFVAGANPRKRWLKTYGEMLAANLEGKPSFMGTIADRVVGDLSSAIGRPYMPGDAGRAVLSMNALLYSSLLAGNRRYPVMSIATSFATSSAEFGMFRTLKGMFMNATPEGQAIAKAAGIGKQWEKIFEQGNALGKLSRIAAGGRPFTVSIQDTENFIRGMGFWASIDESLKALGYSNLDQAIADGMHTKVIYDAIRTTEEVNHFFGVAAKPPIFGRISRSGSALGTQFLSFGPKQTEQLLAMAKSDPGKIGTYMMLSGWITRVAAQEMGIDMSDYVGFGYMKDYGTRGITSPGVQVLYDMAVLMTEMTKMTVADGNPVAAQEAMEKLMKDAENFIPYFQGVRSVVRAEEALRTGELRTPGEGGGRPVNLEIGDKGDRGEMFALLSSMRSMEQGQHEDALNKIYHLKETAALERLDLVEKAFRASRDGNTAEMIKQLQRMQALGFPIGDLTDSVRSRKETEALYWYYNVIRKDKSMLRRIMPVMEEYGILER